MSPCVLPLVPPYLAFIGGVSIAQMTDDAGGSRRGVLLAALAFVAGFTTVFVALGATASVIGQAITAHLQMFSVVAGVLIVAMGLHFLGAIRIPLFDRSARIDATPARGLAGAYLVGLAFAFGWSPCVGPVLAAILLIAAAKESVGEGARLLFVYAAGLGLPFLLAAAFAGPFMRLAARFRGRLGLVEKGVGVFLIVTGLLVTSGNMPVIANWLYETFPSLSRIG